MEVVLAREEVGYRQPHERQAAAVGAASDGFRADLQASAAHGLGGVLGDLWATIEHLPHVPVRFLNMDLNPARRMASGHRASQMLDEPLLVDESATVEVPNQQPNRRSIDSGLNRSSPATCPRAR